MFTINKKTSHLFSISAFHLIPLMSIFLNFIGSDLIASSVDDNYRHPSAGSSDMQPISSAVKSSAKSASDDYNRSPEEIPPFYLCTVKPGIMAAIDEYLGISSKYKNEVTELNNSRTKYYGKLPKRALEILNTYKKAQDGCLIQDVMDKCHPNRPNRRYPFFYFFKNLNLGIFHNPSLFFASCIKEYSTQLANDKAAYDAANNALNAEKKFTSDLKSIYDTEFNGEFDGDYYEFSEFHNSLDQSLDKLRDYPVNNILTLNLKACSKEMNKWIESIKRKLVELLPDKKCQDEEPCELKNLNLPRSNIQSALESMINKYNEQIATSTSHDASMKFYQFLINSAKCHPLKNFISRFFCKFCPAICLPH